MKDNFLYTVKFLFAPIIATCILLFANPYDNFKGIESFGLFFVVFVLVPILDFIFPPSIINPSTREEEEDIRKNKFFDMLVWIILPIQLLSVGMFLIEFHQRYNSESTLTLLGWTLSTGLLCGILGINVGHELGHRVNSWQRFIGKALLWTSLRMSFYIEHNWGHHQHVSTDADPASAKRNEMVYSFIPKSIFKTWLNSWVIQRNLLKKANKSFFSIYNDVLWYTIIQWGTLLAITIIFDWQTTLAFVCASFIGMSLLELVNYIEHYGLRREKDSNGKYERTLPIHSWNSNHAFSGAVLFNLSRHSDHHYIASRPYQILRNYDTVPNMPNGYAGMIVLSLFPPLWFYLMNKKVDQVMNLNKKGFTPTTMDSYA
jgi:alkane 1-monooxygenase